MVCARVPHSMPAGGQQGLGGGCHTGAVIELGEQLVGQGIEKVTLESTSDYWRIWFYVLEAAGLDVQLVNARDAKNMPGRPKTRPVNRTTGRSSRGGRTDGIPGGYRRGP